MPTPLRAIPKLLRNLILRFPELRLAVPESELQLAPMPLWSRYRALPVTPGPASSRGA